MKRIRIWLLTAALLVCCQGAYRGQAFASTGPAVRPHVLPPGMTALSGQVLQLNGKPLADVTLRIRDAVAVTDRAGRFMLKGIPAGRQILRIEGSTADRPGKACGDFETIVDILAGYQMTLPYKIWIPALDTAHGVWVSSPTKKEVVVTNPDMPGLELHIPPGTVITDWYGRKVHRVSITPIPVDRTPFPIPPLAAYFTIQPGGAYLSSINGQYKGARLIYPNALHRKPGARYGFWSYDPDSGRPGWTMYGYGRVDPTGAKVIPDPGVETHSFMGAGGGPPTHVASNSLAPAVHPAPNGGSCAGDPVECGTGLLEEGHTDFFLPGTMPIRLAHTYRTGSVWAMSFGVGQASNYDLYLVADADKYDIDLILPDGAQVFYHRYNDNLALYDSTRDSGIFTGSHLYWNGSYWALTLANGTQLWFPDGSSAAVPLQAAVVEMVDRFGNTLKIYRNSDGQMTSIQSSDGRSLTFTYGNYTITVTDNLGRSVTYALYSTFYLANVEDAKGGYTTYNYNSNNLLAYMTDPRGNYPVSNIQYDACYRVSQETQADGGIWHFSYTPAGSPCWPVSETVITDPRGYVTDRYFDSLGYLTESVEAVGKTEQQTTQITRYSNEQIEFITDPLGRETNFTYSIWSAYDGGFATDNVKSVTRLYGTSNAITTNYTYEPTYNQLATVQDPLGHTWTIGYDSNDNPSSITDPLNNQSTLYVTPSTGLLNHVADPFGNTTWFGYNSYGDLYTIYDPLANQTYIGTDAAGRVTSIFDPLRNTTNFQYDNLDHLTQITDPKGGVTKLGYDPNENLTSVIDANNNQTSFAYDTMNRRQSRTDALNKAGSYQYDYNGNLTQYTDRNGHYVHYAYDGINRRTQANFQGGTDVINYTWDGGDRLCQASDSVAGTITRQYGQTCSTTGTNTTLASGLDFLTQESTPQGTVSYGTPDNAGRRTSMTVAGQNAVSYTFDNANRLTQITQSGTGTVTIGYDSGDRRTCVTLPNGVMESYGYDADSHLQTIRYGTVGSCGDNAGNLGTLAYNYDPNGRRNSVSGTSAAIYIPSAYECTNTYNADNEMTKYCGIDAAYETPAYDSNGQMTADDADNYTWDVRRHLSAISGYDTASFVYDALGRRIKKTVDGTTTQFLYDGLNPVQELNGSGSVVANMLTGLNVDEYFVRTEPSCCGPLRYLTDALGSTIALVDITGTIQYNYHYEPFGADGSTIYNVNTTSSYEFTGREEDEIGVGSDLMYYRARYYNPAYQRFISQDPIGFLGGDANLYSYTGNDPVNYRDATGQLLIGGLVVGIACAAYELYDLHSLLSDENALANQIDALRQQAQDLSNQESSCPEGDLEREQQIREQMGEIDEKAFDLTEQLAAAHAADVARGLVITTACFGLTAVASSPLVPF
jgi:RHS repeat-associated protein